MDNREFKINDDFKIQGKSARLSDFTNLQE